MNWYILNKISMPLPNAENYPDKSQIFTDIDNSLSKENSDKINRDHPGLSYLGHGSKGIAYNHFGEETVVKITKSGREIERAKMQMERGLDCLVKVFDVQNMGGVAKIVTEKVDPLTFEESKEINRVMGIWNDTWKFPKDSLLAIQFELLWRSLEQYGIDTGDVYSRNIGKRKSNGQLVLLDLG